MREYAGLTKSPGPSSVVVCSTRSEAMICERCGAAQPDEATSCGACGFGFRRPQRAVRLAAALLAMSAALCALVVTPFLMERPAVEARPLAATPRSYPGA